MFSNVNYQPNKIVFSFENCKFKTLEIENTDLIKFEKIHFSFFSCYFDNIIVKNIHTNNCSFYFGASIIDGIIDNKNILNVQVSNCLLKSTLFLKNIKNVSISYTENNIFILRWRKLYKKSNVSFDNLLSHKMHYFVIDCNSTYFRVLEDSSSEKGVYKEQFSKNRLDKFRYRLDDDEKLKFEIILSLTYSQKKSHQVTRISKAKLYSLTIEGSSLGKVTVENSKIDNIYINNFSTLEKCDFFDLRPLRDKSSKKRIEIKHSNLNNVWFDNISFDDYSDVSFYRNNYNGTKITSCLFPIRIEGFKKFISVENIHYKDKKDHNYYSIEYEMFLQLKKVLEHSDEFHEAKKLRTVSLITLQKIETLPFWDKLILKINNLSNRHGISIARPLGWLLLISIVLYVLYLATLGKIFINTGIDWTLFGYYFSFLDVTHRLDFLVDRKELSGLIIFIDYANKVVVGFLIFQFVAAFRKYTRL